MHGLPLTPMRDGKGTSVWMNEVLCPGTTTLLYVRGVDPQRDL